MAGAPKRALFPIHLFRYMAGVSHQKILRRWTHSRSFSEKLYNIPAENVPLPSQSLHVAPLVNGQSADYDSDALENDEMFLEDFVKRISKLSFITVNIPNLSKLAHSLPKPCLIYNDETSSEFHQLLLNLLRGLEKALQDIAASVGGGKESSEKLKGLSGKRRNARMHYLD